MPTMTMPNKLYQQLEKAAQMIGMSKATVLENALSRYLAELQEDAEDTERAEKAWNDFENSREAAIPAEALYKALEL